MAAIKSNGKSVSTNHLLAARSSDFHGTESLQPWLEQVMVFMILLALLAVYLRVRSRRLNHVPLWYDDWLAIGSMFWFMIIAAFVAIDISLGLGHHQQFVPTGNKPRMIQISLVVDIMYTWSLVWTKLSLLGLYYRVFGFGYFKRACWIVAAVVVAWAIISTVFLFILCVPLKKYWEYTVKGYCYDPAPVRLSNSIATIVTDVMILCLPIPQIWGLHGLRVSDRLGLTTLFALGFFVVSVAAVRILIQQGDQSDDKSFTLAPDAGWLLIEMSAAIVSASFPAMGPAVIEIWQYIQHLVDACLGRKAHGNAARSRQGMELRTRSEELSHDGMGSPQQHPDEIEGSFHRLYSKGQNGSVVTHVAENGQPLPSHETKDSEGESHSPPETVQSDAVSEEVPLHVILQQTGAMQSNRQ